MECYSSCSGYCSNLQPFQREGPSDPCYVLAVQPLLIILVLGARAMLHSTPLDTGFGLVSILAGIDHGSLDGLASATLSGELAKMVKLLLRPSHHQDYEARVDYRFSLDSTESVRSGKLDAKVEYH